MKIQTEITPYGPTRVLHHAASQQLALRLSGDAAPTFTTSSALFYLLEEQAVLAKLMKPKSFPKDHVRRFFLRAEAYRVFWSARRLRIIGVDTPELGRLNRPICLDRFLDLSYWPEIQSESVF